MDNFIYFVDKGAVQISQKVIYYRQSKRKENLTNQKGKQNGKTKTS